MRRNVELLNLEVNDKFNFIYFILKSLNFHLEFA